MSTREQHLERIEKLTREIVHYIRMRLGCPLCYQIGHKPKDCPSRK